MDLVPGMKAPRQREQAGSWYEGLVEVEEGGDIRCGTRLGRLYPLLLIGRIA